MTGLGALIRRNCKLFFKDKGMFFTSLITPVILLVLYATFLAKVYRDSFAAAMPAGFAVDAALIDGTVGGQLVSSLLAVCCVTVAFCSNLLMVQDRISGARRDLTMTPVRRSTLALGYFAASALSTLLICYAALAVCLGYLAVTGWYLSAADVLLLGLDVLLLSLFGTALSSIVNCNLTTNGQASAVGTIVSAGYGFLCGAYMPISNFGEGLQGPILPPRHIWDGAVPQPRAARGVCGDDADRLPGGSRGAYQGLHRLQSLFLWQQGQHRSDDRRDGRERSRADRDLYFDESSEKNRLNLHKRNET